MDDLGCLSDSVRVQRCTDDPSKGVGVFCTAPLDAGTVVLDERPLLCCVTRATKRRLVDTGLVCPHCLRFLAHTAGSNAAGAVPQENGVSGLRPLLLDALSSAASPGVNVPCPLPLDVSGGFLESRGMILPKGRPTTGPVLYCSDACAVAAGKISAPNASYEQELGSLPDSLADSFHLAARWFIGIGRELAIGSSDETPLPLCQAAASFFHDSFDAIYEEAYEQNKLCPQEPVDQLPEPCELRALSDRLAALLPSLVSHSTQLVSRVPWTAECSTDRDILDRLLGALQRNASRVIVQSPLLAYFKVAELHSKGHELDALRPCLRALARTRTILPRAEGLAIFSQHHLFNHSCRPNCGAGDARRRSTDDPALPRSFGPARICIRTLTDVLPGDELTIAYVDTEQPLAERRSDLFRCFGFTCNCFKCQADTGCEVDKESSDGES